MTPVIFIVLASVIATEVSMNYVQMHSQFVEIRVLEEGGESI